MLQRWATCPTRFPPNAQKIAKIIVDPYTQRHIELPFCSAHSKQMWIVLFLSTLSPVNTVVDFTLFTLVPVHLTTVFAFFVLTEKQQLRITERQRLCCPEEKLWCCCVWRPHGHARGIRCKMFVLPSITKKMVLSWCFWFKFQFLLVS